MSLPKIVAVRQDDGSWVAYDNNKFDGEDNNSLKIGRGDTREQALEDLVEAYEWTDAGQGFVRQVVFALADVER